MFAAYLLRTVLRMQAKAGDNKVFYYGESATGDDHQIRLTADIGKGLIFSRDLQGRVRVNGGCKERTNFNFIYVFGVFLARKMLPNSVSYYRAEPSKVPAAAPRPRGWCKATVAHRGHNPRSLSDRTS